MFATTRMALLPHSGGAIGGDFFSSAQKPQNDTVIVTFARSEWKAPLATPDIETPQSVSIITRQQFEEQGANQRASGGQLHPVRIQ